MMITAGRYDARMSHPRIIRKYPNRRLYDTARGEFINIDAIRQLVLDGEDFAVIDSKTKQDITRGTLLQIIVEAEESGEPLLSTRVLKQMIRFYGHVMQSAFGRYLERSLDQFLAQQDEFQRQFDKLLDAGPMGAMQDMLKAQGKLWESWLGGERPRDGKDDT